MPNIKSTYYMIVYIAQKQAKLTYCVGSQDSNPGGGGG